MRCSRGVENLVVDDEGEASRAKQKAERPGKLEREGDGREGDAACLLHLRAPACIVRRAAALLHLSLVCLSQSVCLLWVLAGPQRGSRGSGSGCWRPGAVLTSGVLFW
jgi:hypothetical protein